MSRMMERRLLLKSGVSLALLPAAARARTNATTVIEGRTFRGTRAAGALKGAGGEGLRAKSGTLIRNCRFLDLGNGAVRVNVATEHLVVEDCEARNLYRFLEDTSSKKAGPAPLTNFAVRRVKASNLDRSMARIRYSSSQGQFEDAIAQGSSHCDLYCVGFQLEGKAHHISYLRCEAHDFREANRPKDKYWNGDGFSDERGNHAIRYTSCTASGCTDGGFDLKSADVRLEDCVSRGNKRNFRLWNSGQLRRCRSEDPHYFGGTGGPAHFSFHGGAERYVLDRPVVRAGPGNRAPVFLIDTDKPITLEIRNADIDAGSAPLFEIVGPKPKIVWVPARDKQKIKVAKEQAKT